MKKIIISIILILLNSCTSLNKNIDSIEYSKFLEKKTQLEKINEDENKKENIDKFFVKGLRNSIILNKIKQIDFSNVLIIIPNEGIKLEKNNTINTLVIINISTTSAYFNAIWVYADNEWKISTIYEK